MAFHRNAAQTNASNEAARITSIVAGQNLTCAPSRQDPGAVAWCVQTDRKSTRLNSSHSQISSAVFCLKKKGGDGGGHDGNHSHDGKSGGGDQSKSQHSNENDSHGSAHTGAAGTGSGSGQSSVATSGAAGTAAASAQSGGVPTGEAGTVGGAG